MVAEASRGRRFGAVLEDWRLFVQRAERLQRSVEHLRRRRLSVGFSSWVTVVETQQRRQNTMRQIERRLRHGVLSHAFEGWVSSIDLVQQLRRTVQYFLSSLLFQTIAVWREWTEWHQVRTAKRLCAGQHCGLDQAGHGHQSLCSVPLPHGGSCTESLEGRGASYARKHNLPSAKRERCCIR